MWPQRPPPPWPPITVAPLAPFAHRPFAAHACVCVFCAVGFLRWGRPCVSVCVGPAAPSACFLPLGDAARMAAEFVPVLGGAPAGQRAR